MLDHLFGFLLEVSSHSAVNKMIPGETDEASQSGPPLPPWPPQALGGCGAHSTCMMSVSFAPLRRVFFLADNLAIGEMRKHTHGG
jgi:hypothetical protein